MIEIEVKVEIPPDEDKLMKLEQRITEELGFTAFPIKHIVDTYFNTKPSEFGGYDFERIRESNKSFTHTKKVWIKGEAEKLRQEEERPLSSDEAKDLLSRQMQIVTIKKKRITFKGVVDARETSIDLDRLEIDAQSRAFIEAETLVEEGDPDIPNIRRNMFTFLEEFLNHPIHEAPSMLEIALGK